MPTYSNNGRSSALPIDPIFIDRWSPRGFSDAEIAPVTLDTLFEAARWAPSAFNSQPWRFLYARRGDAHWQGFLELLIPFNRSWAQHAAVLVFVVSLSRTTQPGTDKIVDLYSHSFDAGAAWANLALQASRIGLAAHGMSGFDHDAAPGVLNLPDDHRVEAAVAIGMPGDASQLSESLAARERPSERTPLEHMVFNGPLGG